MAVVVIIGVLVAAQFGRQVYANWEIGQRAAAIEAEIAAIEAENAELRRELEYLRSDAYISAEARRLANLGAPGEQVLIIPPGAEAPLSDELGSGSRAAEADARAVGRPLLRTDRLATPLASDESAPIGASGVLGWVRPISRFAPVVTTARRGRHADPRPIRRSQPARNGPVPAPHWNIGSWRAWRQSLGASSVGSLARPGVASAFGPASRTSADTPSAYASKFSANIAASSRGLGIVGVRIGPGVARPQQPGWHAGHRGRDLDAEHRIGLVRRRRPAHRSARRAPSSGCGRCASARRPRTDRRSSRCSPATPARRGARGARRAWRRTRRGGAAGTARRSRPRTWRAAR